jgi:hypothetical protein
MIIDLLDATQRTACADPIALPANMAATVTLKSLPLGGHCTSTVSDSMIKSGGESHGGGHEVLDVCAGVGAGARC